MGKRGRPRYPDILTPREWEVLALLREELSNEQIAQRLGITERTAKYHVAEILGKLGVGSRQEAAAWEPEQRPWWLAAAAPLAFFRRRLSFGWLSPATTAAVAVVVATGVGLLVWGLLQIGTEGRQPSMLVVQNPTPTATPAAPRADSRLVVALGQSDRPLLLVDPLEGSVFGQLEAGPQPWALLRPSKGQLLVAQYFDPEADGQALHVYDVADLSQPIATIPMERGSTHIYIPGMILSNNGQFVYYYTQRHTVCPEATICENDYVLGIIDLETGTEITSGSIPIDCGSGQLTPIGDDDVLLLCSYPVPTLRRVTPDGEATMLATFPVRDEGSVTIGMADGDGMYVVYSDGAVMTEGRSTPLVDLLPEEGDRVGWQTAAPLGADRHLFLYGYKPPLPKIFLSIPIPRTSVSLPPSFRSSSYSSYPYEKLLIFDKADPANYQTFELPFPVHRAAPIDAGHIALLEAMEDRLYVLELATGDIVGSVAIDSGAGRLVGD